MKKDFLKYGNLTAFIFVVVFNVLATIGVLGGVSTRDISYMYKSLLTPADFAFSIWGVIYILLAIMVIRQFRNDEIREKNNYWFIISCVLNVGWILAWQYRKISFSFVLILILLIDLIILMRSFENSDLLSSLSIGLYTGWINVAMLANLGALLSIQMNVWAILCLLFGLLWISFFLLKYSNLFYALGACWGYLGIALASQVPGVIIVTIVSMIVFAGSSFWIIRSNKLTY